MKSTINAGGGNLSVEEGLAIQEALEDGPIHVQGFGFGIHGVRQDPFMFRIRTTPLHVLCWIKLFQVDSACHRRQPGFRGGPCVSGSSGGWPRPLARCTRPPRRPATETHEEKFIDYKFSMIKTLYEGCCSTRISIVLIHQRNVRYNLKKFALQMSVLKERCVMRFRKLLRMAPSSRAMYHRRPYVGASQVRSWSHWFVLGAIS